MGIDAPSCTVWHAFFSTHGTFCLYLDGAVFLCSGGDAYAFDDMGIGVPSCTVWQAFLSSHGAVCLYLDGAVFLYSGGDAYVFNDMGGHWYAFLHRAASILV